MNTIDVIVARKQAIGHRQPLHRTDPPPGRPRVRQPRRAARSGLGDGVTLRPDAAAIAGIVVDLLDTASLEVQDSPAVRAAVRRYGRGGVDLHDCLIVGLAAQRKAKTVTFDARAAKRLGMELLKCRLSPDWFSRATTSGGVPRSATKPSRTVPSSECRRGPC